MSYSEVALSPIGSAVNSTRQSRVSHDLSLEFDTYAKIIRDKNGDILFHKRASDLVQDEIEMDCEI